MREVVGKETPLKKMDNRRIFMTSHMTLSAYPFYCFIVYFSMLNRRCSLIFFQQTFFLTPYYQKYIKKCVFPPTEMITNYP